MDNDLSVIRERYPAPGDHQWLEYLEGEMAVSATERKLRDLPFLSPYRRQMTEEALSIKSLFDYMVFGGYPGAKRCRVRFWPAEIAVAEMPLVVALNIKGDFSRSATGDNEILNVLYNEGFSEELCGDFVRDNNDTIYLFLAKEPSEKVQDALRNTFSHINEIRAEKELDFEKLSFGRNKIIKGTVASLRLDAVASLGWGLSRSKAAVNIKSGLVSVNWKAEKNPSFKVKEKDFISLRSGTGFIVDSLPGKSRKGRDNIIIKKIY